VVSESVDFECDMSPQAAKNNASERNLLQGNYLEMGEVSPCIDKLLAFGRMKASGRAYVTDAKE
jgi:hypothetical protein